MSNNVLNGVINKIAVKYFTDFTAYYLAVVIEETFQEDNEYS